MGSVRMSADLVRRIKTNATKPFTDKINSEFSRLSQDRTLLRMIRMHHAGGNTALVDAIETIETQSNGEEWFGRWRDPYINIPGHSFQLQGNVKQQHSLTWDSIGKAAQEYIEANRKTIDRATTDRDNILGLIDEIAENCTTLKQAEQVLPSILDWVPQEVLAKHRKPNTPQRNKLDIAAVRSSVLDQEKISAINRARIK